MCKLKCIGENFVSLSFFFFFFKKELEENRRLMFFVVYVSCRIIGQTAFNGKHQWILADGPSGEWNSFRSTENKDTFQVFLLQLFTV